MSISLSEERPALELACEHLARGHFAAAALAVADEVPSAGRYLLAAQVAHRLRNPAEALRHVREGDAGGFYTSEQHRALAAALEGACLAALKRSDEARARIRDVHVPVGPDTELAGEATYYVALTAWMLGEYRSANATIVERNTRVSPGLAARFEFLSGWISAAEERYGEQMHHNMQALKLLESDSVGDAGLLASVARSISALIRDSADATAVPLVTRLEQTIPWTPHTTFERFQVLRTLAWANAMAGEYILAIKQLNRAKQLAPTPQAKMLSHLDHAWIAQISHEPLHAAAQLADADDWSKQVDWARANDDEIGVLILAAELYAPVDNDRAKAYLEKALGQFDRSGPSVGFAHDRRMRAFYDFAEARVRLAAGDRRVAMHRAERALTVFRSIGYRWRAANAALLLHRLGAEGDWLSEVAGVAASYPRSFIAAEHARLTSGKQSPLETLTRRQREIVALIKAGKKNADVAVALNMSINTVRVHKGRIFRAFDVKTEFDLLKRLTEFEPAA